MTVSPAALEVLAEIGVGTKPPPPPQSQQLIDFLESHGYTFRLNELDDKVEINDSPQSDIHMAQIRTLLRDNDLGKKLKAAEDAIVAYAAKHSYHPIRQYLNACAEAYDGEDHVSRLLAYIHSDDPPVRYESGLEMPLHAIYFYRWMLGAVQRAYTGLQNPMLVLDGAQGVGKSSLVAWLSSNVERFFAVGIINPQDKDADVRLTNTWIWEVSELDATTRKSDLSALKAYITKEKVVVRPAYARYDLHKPALTNFIGTVNNSTGFLADDTGSRRFMVTHITAIDLAYQELDVNQIWGQMVTRYRNGERPELLDEERAARDANNENYRVESSIDWYLEKYYWFGEHYDEAVASVDILSTLERFGAKLGGSPAQQVRELASSLRKLGAKQKKTNKGNRWVGLARNTTDIDE